MVARVCKGGTKKAIDEKKKHNTAMDFKIGKPDLGQKVAEFVKPEIAKQKQKLLGSLVPILNDVAEENFPLKFVVKKEPHYEHNVGAGNGFRDLGQDLEISKVKVDKDEKHGDSVPLLIIRLLDRKEGFNYLDLKSGYGAHTKGADITSINLVKRRDGTVYLDGPRYNDDRTMDDVWLLEKLNSAFEIVNSKKE